VRARWLPALTVLCAFGQQTPAPSAAELQELQRSLAEANTSQIEVLRVIEKYLAVHPATIYRPDLEHRAAEAAIAIHDNARIVRYGEASLARVPDDTKLLPAVTRALLALDTHEAATHALQFARHTAELVRHMQTAGNPGNVSPVEWRDQTDRLLNRALTDEARATGMLGKPDEALALARQAFDTYPDSPAAREVAYWYDRLKQLKESTDWLADAFMIPDAKTGDAERAADRALLGERYRQLRGSEEGLGALCLAAYDRTAAILKARQQSLDKGEPDAGRSGALAFTLTGLDGKKLALQTLHGKVIVMDFWATWCVPCREQHPLYEQVKQRFRDNPAVVFLSVDADADRSAVAPFIERAKWTGPVYFEDGLMQAFSIDGLPATILLDRNGSLYTRLNGFADKNHFADLLAERIGDALAVGQK
jgi:thiol-disulfide isomerase/thioredoxin